MNDNHNGDSVKIPWTPGRVFLDEVTGLMIRANVRLLPPKFPGSVPLIQFSWEFCRQKDDKIVRFFPTFFDVEHGHVSVEPFPLDVFRNLLDEYEAWATSERQKRENEILARRSGVR